MRMADAISPTLPTLPLPLSQSHCTAVLDWVQTVPSVSPLMPTTSVMSVTVPTHPAPLNLSVVVPSSLTLLIVTYQSYLQ